jgi:porphobilinogen synthase
LVRETELSLNDFILPLFVVPGKKFRKEVGSMPEVFQLSVDELIRECAGVKALGIPAVILFGIPEHKDEMGSDAYNENGIIQTAVRALKKEIPDLLVVTDVCLCEYTSHGHCGIVQGNEIVNDASLELLAKEALTHAQAGADIIAPSDMFDGRVKAIRNISTSRLCHTRQNMRPVFMGHFAMLPRARQSSATADHTRWILRMEMKHFTKWNKTSSRVLISS